MDHHLHSGVFLSNDTMGLQKNWIKPEIQMIKKFLNYQNLLMPNISSALPPQLKDFFEIQFGKNSAHITISEGSVEQSHATVRIKSKQALLFVNH